MTQLSHFSFWAPATDVQLLYDLNLEIKRGEFVIVLHHNREEGKTIILIEHQMDELIRCATRLLLMDGGRIVANPLRPSRRARRRHFRTVGIAHPTSEAICELVYSC